MPAKKQLWGCLYGITPQNEVGCLWVYRQGKTWSLETSSGGGRNVHPASTYLTEAELIWHYSDVEEVRAVHMGTELEKKVKAQLEKLAAERAANG